MRQLWLPTFYNTTDYPWATDFITVLRGVFGPGYDLEVIDGPTIKSMVAESKKHVICFRKVVLEDGAMGRRLSSIARITTATAAPSAAGSPPICCVQRSTSLRACS